MYRRILQSFCSIDQVVFAGDQNMKIYVLRCQMRVFSPRELIIGRIKWHNITIWIYPDHNIHNHLHIMKKKMKIKSEVELASQCKIEAHKWRVREWLLHNTKRAIFLLYPVENKLHSMRWSYLLCTRPTRLVGFLLC